jgi:N-methylhydantoinase A/oxoprolinase/acetone carboxylase beta subunit
VARPRPDDKTVRLGPDSMGAAPGPACYGLGGDQATVTDAFLLLGYLDPARFLGGRRTLDLARAEEVLSTRLAGPLGVSVEEAATMVADTAAGIVADLVAATLAKAGLDPADVTLFAFGGNGSMFAAPVAERLGIATARVFGLGPVFAAFGSSVSDVVHVYERSVTGEGDPKAAADALVAMARRDLAAEGFDPDVATIDVEIDEVARVRARFPVGAYEPVGHPAKDPSTAPAPLARRSVSLGGVRHQAPIYEWESLTGRAAIEGPAVAVGETMTCLVPPGWSLAVDEFANGVLRQG